jgi:hypothetical protein
MNGNKMTNGVLHNIRACAFSETMGKESGSSWETESEDNVEVGSGVGVKDSGGNNSEWEDWIGGNRLETGRGTKESDSKTGRGMKESDSKT